MKKKNLIFQAQIFKDDLSEIIGELDYSFESLKKVEAFIEDTIPEPGKPKRNTFFSSETSDKAFALGCFAGEVIRRSLTTAVWNIDEDDNSPLSISLTNSAGAVGFVINKAYKRVFEGDGDNLAFFAKVLITDLLKEDSKDDSTDHFNEEDRNIDQYDNSRIGMVSNNVDHTSIEIDEANYSENIWIFNNQSQGVDKSSKDAFSYIFINEVKDKYPDLYKEILQAEGEQRVRIIKENDGNYRFQKSHKELFFDGSSMASFQGNMKLNPIQWIKMNTAKVFRITLYLVVSFIAMLKLHWIFTILFIACLLYNVWYWFTTKGTFGGGDVNPGKVISINPDKIAVATDFTKMIGKYPVIKILETKLLKENKVVGKFIPTVATYNDNPHDYPFWSEFHPVPVSHGVADGNHLNYLMSKFSEDDFNQIEDYLSQIESDEAGTYKVNVVTTGWKDYDHVDINKGVRMEGPIQKDKD